ncbi:AAA family ATPase [Kutzneria buriramensis]|uniref:Regulatory LuxR family protein n=1 Tax=Kutzneria buriramensis TaxID=1045776 RepID=A0A3E0HK57_9PSEU|nr:AAA family ATPase [Kutzneria buriramensis]REH46843.1 regulatory LuxR family protein [Kutzneria buriramensis]
MTPTNVAEPGPLFGRDHVVDHIVATVRSPTAPPMILVTGPTGIGRTAVLARVRERVAEQGMATLSLRVAQNDRHRPYAVASRLSAELATTGGDSDGADPAAGTAGQLTTALAAALAGRDNLVVFLDDLHWADHSSVAVVTSLVRTLTGSSTRFVGAFRSPTGDDRSTVDRMRETGTGQVVGLRPLGRAVVAALLTDLLRATPTPELTSAVHRHSRGVPAAVLATVQGYQRAGSLRVTQRHACLASPSQPPELPADHPVFDHLRWLAQPGWSVVKALAVLYPLGAAAPGLIAAAVGVSEGEVVDVLRALRADGVVRPGPTPGSWRFRVPLLATCLTSCHGPYERRQLAQSAVTALWAGDATCADPCYLPQQLVNAGKLVDSERSAKELLARGAAAMVDDGYHAERWLAAAADLVTDSAQRATVLLLHAATSCLHMMFDRALASARTLFAGPVGHLSSDAVLELEIIYVVSLLGTRDVEALEAIASHDWASLPGSDQHRVLIRATAQCALGRFREADETFTATRRIWSSGSGTVVAFGMLSSTCTAAFLGRVTEFDALVANPTAGQFFDGERNLLGLLLQLARILMVLGELGRAQRLLATHMPVTERRPLADQAIEASLAGRWDDALELARLPLATGSTLGYVPAHTTMVRELATILTARGRLTQARTMIDQAVAEQPILTHLLGVPEAELAEILDASDGARQLLVDRLTTASEQGLVIGTDELWLHLCERELAGGDVAAARRCADEIGPIADRLGTDRARRNHLLAQAIAYHDRSAGAAVVRLVRERGQLFEMAGTLVDVASQGLASKKLLHEAYELYGELGALLPRVRLRHVMRALEVTVGDRNATVAESERLLATLVTEGLSNRQLATVLQISEKGVEGRLSRLFQRTGYRSRVELATAILTGAYPT